MKTRRTLAFSASPWRALLESALLGWVWLIGLVGLAPQLQPGSISNLCLIISTSAGFCGALRLRWPAAGWKRNLAEAVAFGVALSALLGGGAALLAEMFGWPALLNKSNLGYLGTLLLLFGSGALLCGFRLAIRVWLWWDQLRRRRLIWAITHGHLTLVVLVALLATMAVSIWSLAFSFSQTSGEPAEPLPLLLINVVRTLFPVIGVMAVLTTIALFVLLPPSALFSYLLARRSAERLVKLAAATSALRAGDYGARVPIQGEDEIAQLQADFNAMSAELQRTLGELQAERDQVRALLAARRELIASVGHELRTPVATVRGYLEAALRRADAPEDLRRDLQVMDDEMARLQDMVADLFTLARAEVGQLPLEIRPTEVARVVRQAVEAQTPLAWAAARVELTTEIAAEAVALADENRLKQALVNLLRNGIRHTPPGGLVVAQVSAEPGAVIIAVRDSGAGIPPGELPHIWERFYRGQGAEDDRAGLGLALVKELVEAMGGSVTVESEPGQGSCFTLRLKSVGL